MNKPLHCPKCTSTVRCGNYHLYVVELDYQLVKNRKFMSKNPKHKNEMDCLYVGSTSHTCVCRLRQHHLHAKKQEDGYVCKCDEKEVFRKFVRAGGKTRGSYYPGVYGMCLRPDLFYHLNPIKDKKYAMVLETELANKLRLAGYAVWQH